MSYRRLAAKEGPCQCQKFAFTFAFAFVTAIRATFSDSAHSQLSERSAQAFAAHRLWALTN